MSIAQLQSALDAHASARTREWWSRYMKGVIPFRGVGIPVIRELVAQWRAQSRLDAAPVAQQFDVALTLIREPIAEDKLAGILYLQEHLVGRVAWRDAVPRYAELYDSGAIADWNICDWFCVRVLGSTIAHAPAAARAIAAWHKADNLWRARSSAVAFVNLVADARHHDLIERACATLIAREERFAKTAVGWVLRELSKHDPERVRRFVQTHERLFSRESVKNATRHLPPRS